MESDDPTTGKLRREQEAREDSEREGEAEALTGPEADAHRRRAEKAAYLQEKLAERERSEHEQSERE